MSDYIIKKGFVFFKVTRIIIQTNQTLEVNLIGN